MLLYLTYRKYILAKVTQFVRYLCICIKIRIGFAIFPLKTRKLRISGLGVICAKSMRLVKQVLLSTAEPKQCFLAARWLSASTPSLVFMVLNEF